MKVKFLMKRFCILNPQAVYFYLICSILCPLFKKINSLYTWYLQKCKTSFLTKWPKKNSLKEILWWFQRYNCTSGFEHDVDFGSISSSWNSQIPTAKEVSISIVISPYYSPRQIKSEAIKAYFRVPRSGIWWNLKI